MTQHTEKLTQCKYCKTKKHLHLSFPEMAGGTAYAIICKGCGTKGDRKWTPERAKESWNHLHS